MATNFDLPELGEEIDSAVVVGVLVGAGDEVEENQSVIEVETDKATVEVPSPVSGRVVEVLVEEGDTVEVGQDFIRLESDGEEPRGSERRGGGTEKKEKAESGAAEAEGERSSEDEEEKKHEEEPEHEEQAEDDADEHEEEAAKDGAAEHDTRATSARGKVEAEDASRVGSPAPSEGERDAPSAAPSVRRFAREIGVDLRRVDGSGPGGRVSIADVKAHARRTRELRADTGWAHDGARPDEDEVEWLPMTNVRRTIARRMRTSWSTIPHVTLHAHATVSSLDEAIERRNSSLAEGDDRLGITAVLLKVLALALKAHPEANARLDPGGERLVRRKLVHVGVAVDTDRGLLVPVVRHADEKSTWTLALELRELAEKARSGRLEPDDMSGGCATLTNLGGLGIDGFTPIVVPGQAVILGVGTMKTVPEHVDGAFRPVEELPLSLSFDHRILDGADGARLMGWIVRALEDPWSLVIDS